MVDGCTQLDRDRCLFSSVCLVNIGTFHNHDQSCTHPNLFIGFVMSLTVINPQRLVTQCAVTPNSTEPFSLFYLIILVFWHATLPFCFTLFAPIRFVLNENQLVNIEHLAAR